jgi:hypothetical protein
MERRRRRRTALALCILHGGMEKRKRRERNERPNGIDSRKHLQNGIDVN